MINPAFINFPEEELFLGRMVIGYGELEISLIHLAGVAIGRKWEVLHACHCVRTEIGKIDIANALAKEAMATHGLGTEFSTLVGHMRHCLKIRNQYAHSHWGDLNGTLSFMNADKTFETPMKPINWKSLSIGLIKLQESFFENTRKWLLFLLITLEERERNHIPYLKRPEEMQLPNLHNPLPPPGRSPKARDSRSQKK